MGTENCEHEWQEDERFASGGVVMLFGSIGNVDRETRMICKKCGTVDYIKVRTQEIKNEN